MLSSATSIFHIASCPQGLSTWQHISFLPSSDHNHPEPCSPRALSLWYTQMNTGRWTQEKGRRVVIKKTSRLLTFHTYFHFVKQLQPFQQWPTDFRKGLFSCSLLENRSKHTSFPNEEEWKVICNYVRFFNVLYNNETTLLVATYLKTMSRDHFP